MADRVAQALSKILFRNMALFPVFLLLATGCALVGVQIITKKGSIGNGLLAMYSMGYVMPPIFSMTVVAVTD
jgi:hypothetical protein